MCTGFTRDTHQYFMKASPVRPGDFIEFFAEIDLSARSRPAPAATAAPTHSSDAARCYPLKVEVFRPSGGSAGGMEGGGGERVCEGAWGG